MAGAIQILKDDHKTVEDLFKRYEEAGEGAVEERRTIRDRVVKELSIHAHIEEVVFYPATREARGGETEELVEEALQEHAEAKQALQKLASLEPGDPQFDQVMSKLIEDVRHHVEEEENEMFPKVNEALSPQDLSDLGDKLQEAKKDAPETPS
jgi:iron-sulfur cluster repair protein YtfE (RIC family)